MIECGIDLGRDEGPGRALDWIDDIAHPQLELIHPLLPTSHAVLREIRANIETARTAVSLCRHILWGDIRDAPILSQSCWGCAQMKGNSHDDFRADGDDLSFLQRIQKSFGTVSELFSSES